MRAACLAILALSLTLSSCRSCSRLDDPTFAGLWEPQAEHTERLARDLQPAHAAAQQRLLDTAKLNLVLWPNGEFAMVVMHSSEYGMDFVSGCVSLQNGELRLQSNERKSEGAELGPEARAVAAAVEGGACRVRRQADELILSLDDGSLAIALALVEAPQ